MQKLRGWLRNRVKKLLFSLRRKLKSGLPRADFYGKATFQTSFYRMINTLPAPVIQPGNDLLNRIIWESRLSIACISSLVYSTVPAVMLSTKCFRLRLPGIETIQGSCPISHERATSVGVIPFPMATSLTKSTKFWFAVLFSGAKRRTTARKSSFPKRVSLPICPVRKPLPRGLNGTSSGDKAKIPDNIEERL